MAHHHFVIQASLPITHHFFRVLEPDNNATSPYIDLSHQPNLMISLAQIPLVDAESVDPNHSREAVVAKPLQRGIQAFCDRELA